VAWITNVARSLSSDLISALTPQYSKEDTVKHFSRHSSLLSVAFMSALMVACAVDREDGGLGFPEAAFDGDGTHDDDGSTDDSAATEVVERVASPDIPGCTIEFAYPSSGAGKVFGRTSIRCATPHNLYVRVALYKDGPQQCWDETFCFSTTCHAQCGVTNPPRDQRWCALGEARIEGGAPVDGPPRCRPLSWDPN
jgi:hypothetical protein